MKNELNFIGPNVTLDDQLLFLGPIIGDEDGPFHRIEDGWSMAHIMHAAGVFPSVKQAKKNGWDKPLPVGYDELTVGKGKLKIYILTHF